MFSDDITTLDLMFAGGSVSLISAEAWGRIKIDIKTLAQKTTNKPNVPCTMCRTWSRVGSFEYCPKCGLQFERTTASIG